MSSWGNYDNANSIPNWAASAVNLRMNHTNANSTYDNVTANAFATTLADGSVRNNNITIGTFAVDANEEAVAKSVTGVAPAHSGWILRKTGSGGRAGRVTQEVLVTLANVIGDGDNSYYANVAINVTNFTTAETVTHSSSNANSAIFTVSPVLTGNTNANLTYQWQVNSNTGSLGWTNVANNTPTATEYVGGTTNTLSVYPYNATANAYVFRVTVTAADEGVSATSANATITIL
jgi:hypothetical protein